MSLTLLMTGAVYQVRKRFSDGRGAARVDKEGDLNPSFPKTAPDKQNRISGEAGFGDGDPDTQNGDEFGDTVEGQQDGAQEDRHEAWKFLLAGGEAGAGQLKRFCPWAEADYWQSRGRSPLHSTGSKSTSSPPKTSLISAATPDEA